MAASSQAAPNDPEYSAQFLSILHNEAKHRERGDAVREHGFVVLARGGSSLAPLQSLCFQQTYNHCLTVRYRVEPAMPIGTLFAAFYTDLAKLILGQDNLRGDFLPESSERLWKLLAINVLPTAAPLMAPPAALELPVSGAPVSVEMTKSIKLSFKEATNVVVPDEQAAQYLRFIELIAATSQGSLDPERLPLASRGFDSESVLRTGDRLVFFCEVAEETGDLSEWEAVKKALFTKLPERVGLVISGAPREFKLTDDPRDPHFLELALPPTEGTLTDLPPSRHRFTQSSFHRDEPATKDELNVEKYANALARFVLHRQTAPPLTIGIHGRWGKGKSSFMQMVNSAIIKLSAANSIAIDGSTRTQQFNDLTSKLINAESEIKATTSKKPRTAQQDEEFWKIWDEYPKNLRAADRLWQTMRNDADFISVVFNAWQYEDAKQTWAGLASEISEAMEGALSWHWRQWLKIRYAWKERRSELILSILLPLAVVCIVGGLFTTGAFRNLVLPDSTNSPVGGLLRLLLPAGSAVLTIWFVSSQFLKVAQPISERVLSYVRLPNYREQMGFQHRVQEDLKYVYQFVMERDARHRIPRRLVVYIDDLDRCSEGKIIDILQAINLILARCNFFVFVGMDTEMIYRAIASRYESNDGDAFPRNYLRKIIQISFYLPEATRSRRLNYVSSLFSRNARLDLGGAAEQPPAQPQTPVAAPPLSPSPSSLPFDLKRVLEIAPALVEDVEDTVAELRAFHDHIGFLEDNPRQIKRLVNLHRLVKILLQDPLSPWSEERQRKLVKWMVFCDVWPFLVDDVLAGKAATNFRVAELNREKEQLEEEALKARIIAVKDKDLEEIRKKEISEEITRLQSSNCIGDLAAKLEQAVGSVALPYLKQLHKFAHSNDDDVLATRDIDDDFREAAYLSQLVRESPEIPSVEEGSERKSSGPAFFA